jgi:hypothetical protein
MLFVVWSRAVLKKYWAWLPSSALAAILSLLAGAKGWNWPHWMYYAVGGVGFVYSFFEVWREEYVPNRQGPRISVDWKSTTTHQDQSDDRRMSTGEDEIKIKNIGTSSAFGVRLGDFSTPQIGWHRRIEIQTLHSNAEKTVRPEFSVEVGPHSHEIGYMRYILAKNPVSLPLLWSDINQTSYVQRLTLHSGEDVRRIRVVYGPIKATRD